MATISVLYTIFKLYQIKFSAPSESNIAQRQTTIRNFLSSFLIMIVFSFSFGVFLMIIHEVQTIFSLFLQEDTGLLS
jgi:hypothetical protein